eukprot:PITA_10203
MIELVENETSSFEEAVEKPRWVDAMVEEYKSIVNNSVWEVVPRSVDKLVVGSRWIFKFKHAKGRSIEKYKAIFAAKGFSQVEVINYGETFSHVAGLKQELYDLNQAPHAWYTRIDNYLTGLDSTKSEADEQLIRSCKEELAREFEMKDMGLVHYFLRLEV